MNNSSFDFKWAVVVPAYNESLTIVNLIEKILNNQPDMLIVVDDCSTDDTKSLIQKCKTTLNLNEESKQKSKTEILINLNNNKNLGKAASLWNGFDYALNNDMDVIITLDGDGQHDPDDINALLNKWAPDKDKIVIGSRQRNKATQPFARFAANKIANFWVSWAAGYRISDSQSGFRAYPSSFIKRIDSLRESNGFVFESEVLIEAAWQHYYSTYVPIKATYPEERRASHFRPFDDISKITKMVATRLFSRFMFLKGLLCVILNCKKTG